MQIIVGSIESVIQSQVEAKTLGDVVFSYADVLDWLVTTTANRWILFKKHPSEAFGAFFLVAIFAYILIINVVYAKPAAFSFFPRKF